MINIPPLLHQLILDDKIDPMASKVYRFFKVYENYDFKTLKGTILSDLEMDNDTFGRLLKQLEDYGLIERTRRPGKTSIYKTKAGIIYK